MSDSSKNRWSWEREVGITFAVVLALAGAAWWIWAGEAVQSGDVARLEGYRATAKWLFWAAVALVAVSLLAPPLLWPIAKVWRWVATGAEWFGSRLVLSLIYYLILTPIGLLRRAFGTDPLARRIEPGRASYWEPRPQTPFDPKRCEKQY